MIIYIFSIAIVVFSGDEQQKISFLEVKYYVVGGWGKLVAIIIKNRGGGEDIYRYIKGPIKLFYGDDYNFYF